MLASQIGIFRTKVEATKQKVIAYYFNLKDYILAAKIPNNYTL